MTVYTVCDVSLLLHYTTQVFYLFFAYLYYFFNTLYSCVLIYVGILREHDCHNSILYYVLASYLFIFIIILNQLGRIIVKRPRTIIWMGRYIRNKLLLLLSFTFTSCIF